MDSTCLALIGGLIPSLSDTLLRNGGMCDALKSYATMEAWAETNHGVPCEPTDSFADAAREAVIHNTVSMDTEFKKRLPHEEIEWAFVRTEARRIQNGKMDMDITMCDENVDPTCVSGQAILVLDTQIRFKSRKEKSGL